MAKNSNRQAAPTVAQTAPAPAPATPPTETQTAPATATTAATPAPVENSAVADAPSVMVEVPIGSAGGHVSRTLRVLDRRHAATLADITQALVLDGAELANNRPVQSSDDALAWLLEKIEAGRSVK